MADTANRALPAVALLAVVLAIAVLAQQQQSDTASFLYLEQCELSSSASAVSSACTTAAFEEISLEADLEDQDEPKGYELHSIADALEHLNAQGMPRAEAQRRGYSDRLGAVAVGLTEGNSVADWEQGFTVKERLLQWLDSLYTTVSPASGQQGAAETLTEGSSSESASVLQGLPTQPAGVLNSYLEEEDCEAIVAELAEGPWLRRFVKCKPAVRPHQLFATGQAGPRQGAVQS